MKQKIDINSLTPEEKAALIEKLRKKKLMERGASYLVNPFQVPSEKKIEKEKAETKNQNQPEIKTEKTQNAELLENAPSSSENVAKGSVESDRQEEIAENVENQETSPKSPDAVDEIADIEQDKKKKKQRTLIKEEKEKEREDNEETTKPQEIVEEIITKSASSLMDNNNTRDVATAQDAEHAHSPSHFPEAGVDFADMNYPLDQLLFLTQRLGSQASGMMGAAMGGSQAQFQQALFGQQPFRAPTQQQRTTVSKPSFLTKPCEKILSLFSMIKLAFLLITMIFLFPKFFMIQSFGFVNFLANKSLLEIFLVGESIMVCLQVFCTIVTHKVVDLAWMNWLSAFNIPYIDQVQVYMQKLVLVYQILRVLASIFSDFLAFSFAHILLTTTEKYFYPIK